MLLIILNSCSESLEEENNILNRIQGEWVEHTGSPTKRWSFENHEVRMGVFSHFFQLDSTKLSISGFEHEIKQLTKDTLKLLNEEGVTYTFSRESKEKVDEKV